MTVLLRFKSRGEHFTFHCRHFTPKLIIFYIKHDYLIALKAKHSDTKPELIDRPKAAPLAYIVPSSLSGEMFLASGSIISAAVLG